MATTLHLPGEIGTAAGGTGTGGTAGTCLEAGTTMGRCSATTRNACTAQSHCEGEMLIDQPRSAHCSAFVHDVSGPKRKVLIHVRFCRDAVIAST